MSFLLHSGELAAGEPGAYQNTDCIRIRNAMIAGLDSKSGVPQQLLCNLRYILRRIPQFPIRWIDLFSPSRKILRSNGSCLSFTPEERRIMLAKLSQADWTTRGLVLLGANFAAPSGDVANLTWTELNEAREKVGGWKRIKTGNSINVAMWDVTEDWMDEVPMEQRGVCVFPELRYRKAELKDPKTNTVQETGDNLSRRRWASVKALKYFDLFLKFCGIHRPGLSYRSFRVSAISNFEASGVPRQATGLQDIQVNRIT